jgi:Uri superfamily endonuclease
VIPALPGTYALVMRCTTPRSITVGRLGELALRPGYYIYVGSALGPGGLAGRLHRHLSPSHVLHWHVDYLGQAMSVDEVWYIADPIRREHEWASILQGTPGMSVPMARFGASDCSCPAHLFYSAESPWLPFVQTLAPSPTPTMKRLQIEVPLQEACRDANIVA